MTKAVFFDIDGTIWDFTNYIPPSTREAIMQLHKNGHLVFLCSGRSRAFIQNPELLSLGFDGVIAGAGTMIEYRGDRIFYRRIPQELAVHTVETTQEYGFRSILEGWDYLYLDKSEFAADNYGRKVINEMGPRLRSISDSWGEWEFSKLSCATDHADREGGFAVLSSDYDICVHNEAVAELLPKGYHKGTGILKICELLGIEIEDTYAFGDSVNDLGMFATAGTAIAMGNASEEAKKIADYVTDDLYQDGIWNACRHFELI